MTKTWPCFLFLFNPVHDFITHEESDGPRSLWQIGDRSKFQESRGKMQIQGNNSKSEVTMGFFSSFPPIFISFCPKVRDIRKNSTLTSMTSFGLRSWKILGTLLLFLSFRSSKFFLQRRLKILKCQLQSLKMAELSFGFRNLVVNFDQKQNRPLWGRLKSNETICYVLNQMNLRRWEYFFQLFIYSFFLKWFLVMEFIYDIGPARYFWHVWNHSPCSLSDFRHWQHSASISILIGILVAYKTSRAKQKMC